MADVTIKLTIANFSVEVTGSPEYAEKKVEELADRYLSCGNRTPSEGTPVANLLAHSGKKVSAAEFLRGAGHKNQTDRGIILGYYLERLNSQPSFTTSELGELGIQTKQPFTNISDIVSRLASRGLMMRSGDKEGQKAYSLTASGEEYVQSMMATNG